LEEERLFVTSKYGWGGAVCMLEK